MTQSPFTQEDVHQIQAHGLTLEDVQRQLALFEGRAPYLRLAAPCTPGEGITVLDEKAVGPLMELYNKNGPSRRRLKFVPASGAASRMFKTLLKYLNQGGDIVKDRVFKEAAAGNADAKKLLTFMEGIERFAFFTDLKNVLIEKGFTPEGLLKEGRFKEIIYFLLEDEGLNYAHRPKGLLKFHEYPQGSRTAFEEHLVEAAFYIQDQVNTCRLHFTVSDEHEDDFRSLFAKVGAEYEKRYGISYDMDFSTQAPSTDTIAVTPDNRPFRLTDGRLLFRPGGHGALLQNLNALQADIIFIKNIDNVVPDRLKEETFRWKRILGGFLLQVQNEIFDHMKRLASGEESASFPSEAVAYLEQRLLYPVPPAMKEAPPSVQRSYVMERLNRPIRVCGMVKNAGEPGGGPFWVKEPNGERSRQIVETAQIDPLDREQQDILQASTHFNPVDLVCGVRDWQGNPFDLGRYTDPDAVFISRKSKQGRDLKALEHPGLWNGAMARWITFFVEVPETTFNPVKTVNDLLRDQHQPG
ncbi:MAG: DUF4301 family protein [Desulfatiglandaceae bacterium]